MNLQQQLIEAQSELASAQKQVIALQKKIDKMTPKNIPDAEIFWYMASGMYSNDAAQSDDPAVVKRLLDWNTAFAKKHIKPYVNPKVFGECLNQMTRGLTERLSELEGKALRAEMEKKRATMAKSAEQAARN